MVLLPVNNVSADMAKPIDVMVLKENRPIQVIMKEIIRKTMVNFADFIIT